ncbi:MAG: hypothetical protein K2W95_08210 [Candidatus Obscuribacterales bacterium]|nr:hypothetical protein [Candidatus Obscuribacterales bacterium]
MLLSTENVDHRVSSSVQFTQAVELLQHSIEEEKRLGFLTEKAIDEIVTASRHAAQLSNGLITCTVDDHVISLSAHNRTITIIRVNGSGRDSRLIHPRCMLCALFLVFIHCQGESNATLHSSFRVYPDGACTDGIVSWKLTDGDIAFEPYVFNLLTEQLLRAELLWSSTSDIPERLKSAPVVDGKLDSKELSKPSIGFESSFTPATCSVSSAQ